MPFPPSTSACTFAIHARGDRPSKTVAPPRKRTATPPLPSPMRGDKPASLPADLSRACLLPGAGINRPQHSKAPTSMPLAHGKTAKGLPRATRTSPRINPGKLHVLPPAQSPPADTHGYADRKPAKEGSFRPSLHTKPDSNQLHRIADSSVRIRVYLQRPRDARRSAARPHAIDHSPPPQSGMRSCACLTLQANATDPR